MFSPMVAIASAIAVSTVTSPTLAALIFSTSAPTLSATCAIILTRPWNCSLRATKSVSELTSTTTPLVPAVTRADQAFRRDAAGLLGGLRQALLAQPVLRRLHVAVVFGERCLQSIMPAPVDLAQVLDHRRCDCCHRCTSFCLSGRPRRGLAASPPSAIRNVMEIGRRWPDRSGQRVRVIPLPRSSPWPGRPSHRRGSEVRPLRRSCARCRDRVRPAASSGRCRDR